MDLYGKPQEHDWSAKRRLPTQIPLISNVHKKKIPLEGYKPENLHVSLFVDKNTKEKSTSISIFQKKVKGLVCLAERYTK